MKSVINISISISIWLIITRGWEVYFRNYRHYVSCCPVSNLDWLPCFPHKVWVDPGGGSFTFQVNCRERGLNRDRPCSNRSPNPLYHGAFHNEYQLKMIACWSRKILTIRSNNKIQQFNSQSGFMNTGVQRFLSTL